MPEYINVGNLSEFTEGKVHPLVIADVKIALVQSEGALYAFSNECTHIGVELTSGEIYGQNIVCWLHGSLFDMSSGARLDGPASDPLTVYDVKVEDDDVLIGKP